MNTVIGAVFFAFALSGVVAAPVAAGPFEDGVAAYNRGDYETTLRLWRPLAERGFAWAQFGLGLMYDRGQAVYSQGGAEPGWAEAAKWYRKAAEQSVGAAQLNLGNLYARGQGIAQNLIEAHKWFSLAAARGYETARRNRDDLARRMTRNQLAEAHRLARRWRPK